MVRARVLHPAFLLILVLGCATPASTGSEAGGASARRGTDTPVTAEPGSLQRAAAALRDGQAIVLRASSYILEPAAYTDPSCGNCEDAAEPVPATLGLRLTGRGVSLRGVHRDSVLIVTRAGYGILVEDCTNCVIRGVTITGGTRDEDGRATSAAIVVRRSTVTIEDCVIRDNIGDSATVARTVVGIAGIAGREGSDITLRNCDVLRNSWDGVALYRGARAHIHDNIIDGVDKASGTRMTGGRGTGIGMTWDARAVVERNRVTRYWKGIGVFVEADADIRENIVEDVLTWGIALWGPSAATPAARIERNVVYRSGACGVMLDAPADGDAPGTFIDNLIMRTGKNERYDSGEPYCWQRPVARVGVPPGFLERGTLLFENRQPREAGTAPPPLPELARETLLARALPLTAHLATLPAHREALLFRELPELRR
jgi:nitrous oxidase accessory protein NosD